MIHSIKIGDPDAKTGTGLDKLLKKVPTKAEAEKWRDAYKTIEKVLLEVVPYSLKHEFVAPDSKYFDGTKYNAVDLRILRWGGIALVLLDGQGGNYSGGYIYMKALVANILKWRRQIERVLQDFYYQIAPNNGRKGALRSKMRDPKTRPRIRFSDNIMKERKQLLDELKFLFEHGGMSWETAHEWMDVSHPVEKQRIVKQWKDDNYKDYFVPVFETSQGLLAPVDRAIYSEESPALKKTTQTEKTTKGQPGRPEVDGKQTDGDKKNRQPRPSES